MPSLICGTYHGSPFATKLSPIQLVLAALFTSRHGISAFVISTTESTIPILIKLSDRAHKPSELLMLVMVFVILDARGKRKKSWLESCQSHMGQIHFQGTPDHLLPQTFMFKFGRLYYR
jgi:hypothetical protein